MKLREVAQLAKATLEADNVSVSPRPATLTPQVPMAGTTLRQSEPQCVMLESHTSLFKATHFSSIRVTRKPLS